MARTLAWMTIIGLLGGCTIERFHRDVRVTTDYARLTKSTNIEYASRWQLSPAMRIGVAEAAPAKQVEWASAAQAGINSVFAVPGDHQDLTLVIAWPSDRVQGQPDEGYVKYLRLDKLALADPLAVRVMLLDAHRDTLIQTATLQLNPRLFAADPGGAEHIRAAFADYAAGLVSRH